MIEGKFTFWMKYTLGKDLNESYTSFANQMNINVKTVFNNKISQKKKIRNKNVTIVEQL